ncbi:sorting nexin-14 isoform X2 [Anoplophora glabripennis]|uniref:sorting nexin-14 isoform X2 n=1 Tax=Anoplophora glabripennis TaxID=217634 RepID=UPI00087556AE|nr:sorting nexin-14 isoform X2 [Anoplophora glabripennis]
MLTSDIFQMINLVSNDRLIKSSAIFITLFVVLIGIFVGYISAIFVYTCYILGYITAWSFVKYPNKVTEGLQRLLSFYRGGISIKNSLKHSCSICDDLSCKRHQQNSTVTPWKHIQISKELNDSVERFYNRIIENFISSWYGQFSNDSDFLNELRYSLRYASASVINRLLELDVAGIITNKLLLFAVKHIDDYLYIRQITNLRNGRFNEVATEYLGKRLHIAATNRKNELAYLQHLVSSILGNILPENYLKCRNYSVIIREILVGWVFLPLMDVLADPNIINYIVILSITYKSKKATKRNVNMEMVTFLENYATVNKKISPFAINLNKIKNNTDLLYAFMQFLKKQEHVHLLQFCLDVDDFNAKLLTPNLSKKQLEELHSDALKLYKDYLNKDSLNFIGCPSDITEDFSHLIKEYITEKLTKIPKLLYRAYDYTFNELETMWLPQFFHSNEFYSYICGSKIVSAYVKPNRSKKYEPNSQGTVSKISSGLVKIKGVLKTNQPIEGSFFPLEAHNVENGTVEDLLLAECKTLFRDLSTWKVTICSYQASPSNKVIYFCVAVERLDLLGDDSRRNWVVLRKDQDFYTLKAKLVEFHGENEICDSPLPSRKAGSSVDIRMVKYEEFLKKLLQKPTLRSSDLLYSFLTTEEDFAIFIATSTPNIQDFGNIYQSVAHKLRKEKGQHLDSFMSAFLSSTGKPRQEKLDWAEVGEEFDTAAGACNVNISFPKTYRNHIFNDNFGVKYSSLKDTMSGSFNPDGFMESIFYLLKHIFTIPNGLLKIYVSLCCVAQQLVDFSCRLFIEHKLKSNLTHSNLAFLIRLLEDVIFNLHVSPTKDELEKRRIQAFKELEQVVPTFASKILGPGLQNGSKTLLEIMQNPQYNKQLIYNLLDIILTEMYPGLGKNPEE